MSNRKSIVNNPKYIIDEFEYSINFQKFVRVYYLDNNETKFIQKPVSDYCYTTATEKDRNTIELYDPHENRSKYKWRYKVAKGRDLFQARRNNVNYNDIDAIRRLAVDNNWVPGSTMSGDKTTQEQIDLPIPSYVPAVALDIETSMTIGSPTNYTAPITAVVLSFNRAGGGHYHKVWLNSEVYKLADVKTVTDKLAANGVGLRVNTEDNLLREVFLELREIKATLVTYNGCDFDLPYFVKRCQVHGIASYFGKEPNEYFAKFGYSNFPHLDLYKIFKNTTLKLYMFANAYERDTLDEVSSAILKRNKITIDFDSCSGEELVMYNVNDGDLTLSLFEEIINSLLFLCRVCCTTLYELQFKSIMKWITNALDYQYQKRGYLIRPNLKSDNKESQQGGLVLTPPIGIETDVFVLDFASEYPTIVGKYNLGSDTVNCGHPECSHNIMLGSNVGVYEYKQNERMLLNINERAYKPIKVCVKYRSIYSDWVETIRDFRVNKAKKLAKTNPEYRFLNGACKVFLNGSVGLFGAEHFRYGDSNVFNAVTRMGQFMLYRLNELLRDFGFDVVYGATDSCFFKSPFEDDETMTRINQIIAFIKDTYKLDLELEKKFAMVFFSGRKSNYLAVTKDGKLEIKGLSAKKKNNTDWIRENFNQFTRKISEMVREDNSVEEIKRFTKEYILESLAYIKKPKESYDGKLNPYLYLQKWNDREYKVKPQFVRAAELVSGREWKLGDEVVYFKSLGEYNAMPVENYDPKLVDIKVYEQLFLSSYEPILQSIGINLNNRSRSKSLISIAENVVRNDKDSRLNKSTSEVTTKVFEKQTPLLEGKGSLMYFLTK